MSDYAPPQDPPAIIHKDAAIIVVDKPSGLLSVPGKGPELDDCMLGRLVARYPGTKLVHRLDRDTSGIMIFARTPEAQRRLGKQFERREVTKCYIARVYGVLAEDRGRVDLPIIVDWPNRPLQMVCHETGRPAQTDWEVLAREDMATRVALTPLTGRSHQLRVHMLALGHPIIGDPFYATGEALAGADRLQLHSEMLSLRHPTGGVPVEWHAVCPF